MDKKAEMKRYSTIEKGGFPREFLLLQGTGCRWRQCTFCDYYDDKGPDPYRVNAGVLEQVTGRFGVLDIINSGSAIEMDGRTIEGIRDVIRRRHIHTLWLEMHYMYRNRLDEFASLFAPARVKFRCGIETFDPGLRDRWKKGIPRSVTPDDVAEHFSGICLLCCTGVEGDTPERLLRDIEIARGRFEYCSINLFCNNGTPLKRDEAFAGRFISEILPALENDPGFEILLGNTDLGVG